MASHFFTSRSGGFSAGSFQENNLALHVGDDLEVVRQNRERLSSIVGKAIFMHQTHGDTVVIVDGNQGEQPEADSMITQSRGIYLAVLTADCIPLLLWDENSLSVAAVHVGRKGLMNGIAVKTVEKMKALGSENIHGVLGPSICGNCYEVGADIFSEVTAKFPEASSQTNTGKPALDLAKSLQQQLTEANVTTVRALSCTVEDPSFFSYRRDGITGRFAGVISL